MPKKIFRRYMPDPNSIRDHKYLRMFFGTLLHDPNLWHLNRRSVAGAFAVGLFNAFMPVPFQMVWSAAFAIWFRVNLPIAVALVWITNPFTIPPMFYSCYKFGAWMLGRPPQKFQFELSVEWLMAELGGIWPSLLLGCLVIGAISALLGYVSIRLLWRLHIVQHWKRRKAVRLAKKQKEKAN